MSGDLAEFLLARISEDEVLAREAVRVDVHPGAHDPMFGARRDDEITSAYWKRIADPDLVLAECEVKRRIVTEVHHPVRDGGRSSEWRGSWEQDACEGCNWGGPTDTYHVEHVNECPTLRLLAIPYASHADYRQEWKP